MRFQIDRTTEFEEPSDELIERVAQKMLEDDLIQIPDGVIEVSLSPSEEIVRLNFQYLQENGITDVLAFEMLEEDPDTGEFLIGCIAVNGELAKLKAVEYCSESEENCDEVEKYQIGEVLMYILHGILHFAGFEDDLPEERKEMFNIAARFIREFDIPVIPYG